MAKKRGKNMEKWCHRMVILTLHAFLKCQINKHKRLNVIVLICQTKSGFVVSELVVGSGEQDKRSERGKQTRSFVRSKAVEGLGTI